MPGFVSNFESGALCNDFVSSLERGELCQVLYLALREVDLCAMFCPIALRVVDFARFCLWLGESWIFFQVLMCL